MLPEAPTRTSPPAIGMDSSYPLCPLCAGADEDDRVGDRGAGAGVGDPQQVTGAGGDRVGGGVGAGQRQHPAGADGDGVGGGPDPGQEGVGGGVADDDVVGVAGVGGDDQRLDPREGEGGAEGIDQDAGEVEVLVGGG